MVNKSDSKLIILPNLLLIRCILLVSLTFSSAIFAQVKDTSSIKLDKPKSGLDAIISYQAKDSLLYNIKENKVYLFGNAELHYGDIDLKAGYIEIDLNTKYIVASGKFDSAGLYSELPELKDGEDKYKADSMEYNGALKKGRVYGLKLKEEGAIVHLNKVLKNEDGSFIGERGKITTCEADHPHFYFDARNIKVIPKNKVIFGAANLVIEDVPTPLAVPFGIAPIKKGRRNGILFPSYGFNQFNKSFYLQQLGYYQGLGPYADLTLSTDIYFSGDFRAGLSSKFKKLYQYSGNIGLNISYFNTSGLEFTDPAYSKSLDFELNTEFRWDPKFHPGHNLGGNLNFKTAAFNRLNSRDPLAANNNLVVSSFTYSTALFKNKLSLTTGINHNQNLETREFNLTLPSVNLSLSSLQPFKSKNSAGTKWYEQIRFSYVNDIQNSLSTYDSLLFSDKGLDEFKKLQTGVRHNIPISANFKAFGGALNLSPYFSYNENWYFEKQSIFRTSDPNNYLDTLTENSLFRTPTYNGGVSMTTNIYGTFQNLPFKNIEAIRHTITPTLNFNYSPKINGIAKDWVGSYTDSFGETRTYSKLMSPLGNSGSREESGSLNFGFSNNIQAKKKLSDTSGKTSFEKINIINRLDFSSGYNFLADSFHFSNLGVVFNTKLFKTLGIDSRGSWSFYDTKDGRIIKSFFAQNDWQKPLRFLSANVTLTAQLNPTLFQKGKAESQYENRYYNFNIPWSLNFNMNTNFRPNREITNSLNLGGSLNLTDEWGASFNTNYDLETNTIIGSSIDITRDLHCWQLSFNWIPSGFYKRWVFTLRPKSNLLQDLKIPKRGQSQPFIFGQ